MRARLCKVVVLGLIALPLALASGCCCALSLCGRFPNGSERPWWWRSSKEVRAEEHLADLPAASGGSVGLGRLGALSISGDVDPAATEWEAP
ncbi:MAG: hypothetical protein ACUVX9_07565 [Anaerolineae bacterium]